MLLIGRNAFHKSRHSEFLPYCERNAVCTVLRFGEKPHCRTYGRKSNSRLGLTLCENGQGRDRTADTRIFSPVLYQLSYLSGFRESRLLIHSFTFLRPVFTLRVPP